MSDLRPAVAQAIADLDAEHRKQDDKLSHLGGCLTCWSDGSVRCVTRQVADGLRAALGE